MTLQRVLDLALSLLLSQWWWGVAVHVALGVGVVAGMHEVALQPRDIQLHGVRLGAGLGPDHIWTT